MPVIRNAGGARSSPFSSGLTPINDSIWFSLLTLFVAVPSCLFGLYQLYLCIHKGLTGSTTVSTSSRSGTDLHSNPNTIHLSATSAPTTTYSAGAYASNPNTVVIPTNSMNATHTQHGLQGSQGLGTGVDPPTPQPGHHPQTDAGTSLNIQNGARADSGTEADTANGHT